MSVPALSPIRSVLIYCGHKVSELWLGRYVERVKGPYLMSIDKHVFMFAEVNRLFCKTWHIEQVYGNDLIDTLRRAVLTSTLLVIPAGEVTHLDEAFSDDEVIAIKQAVHKGLRIYGTCGSAYWMCRERIWNDKCVRSPQSAEHMIRKKSRLDLFQGLSIGPLAMYPGQTYSTGFFHEAIDVEAPGVKVNVLLSGGGAFFPDGGAGQEVRTLATYTLSEVERFNQSADWQIAAIGCRVGAGKAILSMLHPGYGAEDIEVQAYEQAFPDRADDWRLIRERLSPLESRMTFVAKLLEGFEDYSTLASL